MIQNIFDSCLIRDRVLVDYNTGFYKMSLIFVIRDRG